MDVCEGDGVPWWEMLQDKNPSRTTTDWMAGDLAFLLLGFSIFASLSLCRKILRSFVRHQTEWTAMAHNDTVIRLVFECFTVVVVHQQTCTHRHTYRQRQQ